MSRIEKSSGALQAATTGVTTAQQRAAAADHQAGEVQQRAMAVGFGGIAQGMAAVRNDIAEINNRLGALQGPLGEASKAVAAAPREGAPEQTIAALTPAQQRIDTTHQATAGVLTKVEETKQTVQRALQGGQPGPLLGALDAAKQIMLQTRQHVAVAKQEVEAAIVEARQMGSSGN
jgi:hypothetical protein